MKIAINVAAGALVLLASALLSRTAAEWDTWVAI